MNIQSIISRACHTFPHAGHQCRGACMVEGSARSEARCRHLQPRYITAIQAVLTRDRAGFLSSKILGRDAALTAQLSFEPRSAQHERVLWAAAIGDSPHRAVSVLADEESAVMRYRHADGARQTEESFTTKPVMKSSYSPVGIPSFRCMRTTL